MGLPLDTRFFTPEEEAAAGALFDLLLDQQGELRVPVLNMVDARLAEEETDGRHCEDMPRDGDAWRASLAAFDQDATSRRGRVFALLSWQDQGRQPHHLHVGAVADPASGLGH